MSNITTIQAMNKDTYDIFVISIIQIRSFYDEISTLSKKLPDGKLNPFKIKFINKPVSDINKILGLKKPFEEFEQFDEEIMPTNSDVTLMLAQYLKSATKFYNEHTELKGGKTYIVSNGKFSGIEVERIRFLEKL